MDSNRTIRNTESTPNKDNLTNNATQKLGIKKPKYKAKLKKRNTKKERKGNVEINNLKLALHGYLKKTLRASVPYINLCLRKLFIKRSL